MTDGFKAGPRFHAVPGVRPQALCPAAARPRAGDRIGRNAAGHEHIDTLWLTLTRSAEADEALQWTTVQGLRAYGFEALAQEIARRFVGLAEAVYQRTGKLMEKYKVCDLTLPAGGGEYPLQDGFGWTNGVLRAFIADFGLGRAPCGSAAQALSPG